MRTITQHPKKNKLALASKVFTTSKVFTSSVANLKHVSLKRIRQGVTAQTRQVTLFSLLVIALGIWKLSQIKSSPKGNPDLTAQQAFTAANQYARGKGAGVLPFLSKAYRKQCEKLTGMLPIAARIATRGGTIDKIKAGEETYITADSTIVPMQITYQDGRIRKFTQVMVYEQGWKLGLEFTNGEGGF